MAFAGVWLTPGAAVNRRFRTGMRHDSQKIAPKGAPSTARGRARVPSRHQARLILSPDMLAALGRDLPGAVILTPAILAMVPDNRQGQRSAVAGAPSVPPEMKFSLGGMQLKFSMLRQGDRFTYPGDADLGDYIVKPPSSDYQGLPMIEAAAMETARGRRYRHAGSDAGTARSRRSPI